MPHYRVLIVDDDLDLAGALQDQFTLYDEFDTVHMSTGHKGVEAARSEEFDLLICDVGLPDIDGREVVKVLRKGGFKAPVIMLTGHDTDSDTILGLEAGANDYVTKPFRFAVLLARIRAHLRQFEQSEDATFQVGPYLFHPAAKTLKSDDEKIIRLTEKETMILKNLYKSGGRPVARDKLLEEVWGYNAAVTTHTLETHIYRLRQKIEKDSARAEILLTEAGGYRLAMSL